MGYPYECMFTSVTFITTESPTSFMKLPYGTMTDDEMRAMPIPTLQDEGLLFLWVTGRAMEVGRECLRFWGYTRVDEVIWVKTNQVRIFVGRAYLSLMLHVMVSSSVLSVRDALVTGSITPRNTCSWE